MHRCRISIEVIVEFHEVVPIGLAHNMGEFRVGDPFVIYSLVKFMLFVVAMHGSIY